LRRVLWVALALGLGLAVAALRAAPEEGAIAAFGRTVWSARRADLVIQLGLFLVGAFGIRALLPGEGEDAYEPEETIDDALD
jgi:hypothetical protein